MAVGHRVRRREPDWSAGDCREADGGIIAQRGDGFQCHVAAALDRPLVVCSSRIAPMRRTMASSLGKRPTTSVRRLISPLRRSIGLVTGMGFLGANVPLRCSTSWRMVRRSGQRTGSTKCGQADTHDEPRARVSSWPPLRLARLRRERQSVVVVSPAAPVMCLTGGDE